jgi:hypothetical protein
MRLGLAPPSVSWTDPNAKAEASVADVLRIFTEASLDNLFVVAGLVFLGLAVIGKASGQIQLGRGGRAAAGFLGPALIVAGLVIHAGHPKPASGSSPAVTPVPTDTTQHSTPPRTPAPVSPPSHERGNASAGGPPQQPAPAPAEQPARRPTPPQLSLRTFHATSTVAPHPEVRVEVPAGYKIISGGARVDYQEPGNLLTASYPEGTSAWVARSKDHQLPSPAQIEAWAVALYDPTNDWDVQIVSVTSSRVAHPTASVSLPEGYTMTGGGAQANWGTEGSLLTASYPHGPRTWEARSKDHRVSEPATLTVYVIGIRPINGAPSPQSRQFPSQSGRENHPHATARVGAGYVLVGGGALVNWEGQGNLLTASYPDGRGGWTVASKDHIDPDPAVIVAYALGVPQ